TKCTKMGRMREIICPILNAVVQYIGNIGTLKNRILRICKKRESAMTFQSASSNELLKAVRALPPDELDVFVEQVLSLRAKMRAPSISQPETELLQKINESLPETTWRRYRHLVLLRRQERLTETEYEELLRISDTLEKRHIQRMELLVELAALRGQSLD